MNILFLAYQLCLLLWICRFNIRSWGTLASGGIALCQIFDVGEKSL